MKNYQVTFLFDSAPFSHSVFIDNAIMRERMVGDDNPFKCIEFLRRGKSIASFYPSDNLKYEIRVLE